MEKINPDDAAHSVSLPQGYEKGLTKREYFAAMAMQGLLATSKPMNSGTVITQDDIAKMSVACADSLITELNK